MISSGSSSFLESDVDNPKLVETSQLGSSSFESPKGTKTENDSRSIETEMTEILEKMQVKVEQLSNERDELERNANEARLCYIKLEKELEKFKEQDEALKKQRDVVLKYDCKFP